MSRNQGVAGFGGLEDDLLIEQRPVKFTAELAGNGALTERAIAAQVAKVAATTACQYGGKQEGEKLRLWLGESRHMH